MIDVVARQVRRKDLDRDLAVKARNVFRHQEEHGQGLRGSIEGAREIATLSEGLSAFRQSRVMDLPLTGVSNIVYRPSSEACRSR